MAGLVRGRLAVTRLHLLHEHFREMKLASPHGDIEEDVERDIGPLHARFLLHFSPDVEGGFDFGLGDAIKAAPCKGDGGAPFGFGYADVGSFHVI